MAVGYAPPVPARFLVTATFALAALLVAPAALAQEEEKSESFSAEELDQIVGPIALYPDDLLGLVLPASTYPLQVVQASRFLEKYEKDKSLEPDKDWDESVIGLLNYPDVIDKMNEDLDWTWKLGEAVADQQNDLMNAVQRFRGKADAAGNLEAGGVVPAVRVAQADNETFHDPGASRSTVRSRKWVAQEMHGS